MWINTLLTGKDLKGSGSGGFNWRTRPKKWRYFYLMCKICFYERNIRTDWGNFLFTVSFNEESYLLDITLCGPLRSTQMFRRNVSPPSSGSNNKPRPTSSWFLAWLILPSRRWRRHVPPEIRLTFNGLHGVISQKIESSQPPLWEPQILHLITMFTRARHRTLSWDTRVQMTPSFYISLRYILILSSDLRLYVRFDVLTAVTINSILSSWMWRRVVWYKFTDISEESVADMLACLACSLTLKMDVGLSSETSVTF
jgi:hypothetical protein